MKSELFSPAESIATRPVSSPGFAKSLRNLSETAIVFFLIFGAIWTRQGDVNLAFTLTAMVCVMTFAILGKFNVREMGLTRPVSGVAYIALAGALSCVAVVGLGILLRPLGHNYSVPLRRSGQYAIWALEQEFILQSIFFVRLEDIFGSGRAVLAAASLFTVAHIPNPVLTPLAFLGGILFCELFRRWRNLYPLGIIHAALGLTIAASLPDKWLHHMRVGIAYFLLRH